MAIVKVDKRHYRKIAQENWGLTDAQMKGMHVHHRRPQSKGGTNDASNLYVCSPSFHYYAWHDGVDSLKITMRSAAGGRAGKGVSKSSKGRKIPNNAREITPEQKEFLSTFGKERDIDYLRAKVTCPHCGKIGDKGPMSRWHFDKCKNK